MNRPIRKSHFIHTPLTEPSIMIITKKKAEAKANRQEFSSLVKLADEARNAGKHSVAGLLYEKALLLRPERTDLHMQCGHCLKESRDFERAEQHYLTVLERESDKFETHIQLGHFYKTIGRLDRARHHYERAFEMDPHNEDANREVDEIRKREREIEKAREATGSFQNAGDGSVFIDKDLFPLTAGELKRDYGSEFVLMRLGGYKRSPWGEGHFLSGIDCIRGYIVSDVPVVKATVYISGAKVYEGLIKGHELADERDYGRHRKYPFNAWFDVSGFEYGWHEVVLKVENVRGDTREGIDWRRERVLVLPAEDDRAFLESDAVVPLPPAAFQGTIEEWVNSRPSVVHQVSSNSFPIDPKTVLVQRLDQLGDLSVSVPAIMRLRGLLPNAKIVGLVGPANEGLARSLKQFDEIISFDVPDDPVHKRRILSAEGQKQLAALLRPYNFDVAIDLAVSGITHQLLHLSNAPVILSYGSASWRSMSLNMSTREPRTRNDVMRHSARTLALIEMMGTWLNSRAQIVKRNDLDRSFLRSIGIADDERYVVLHAGARIRFTQWPYFTDLAERLVRETGSKVVFLADNPVQASNLRERSLDIADRLIVLEGKLEFDEFDALLSYSSVFVGNDSGPKHLAALRGAKVVSIHSSRIGWSEWGQELGGVVISRQVPCAGCSLHHNYDECDKDVACVKYITVDEVYKEVVRLQ